MRLDQFLAGKPDILSRAHAQKLIERGHVTVNGRKETKASRDIDSRHVVEYTLEEAAAVPDGVTSKMTLEVLYEDDDCFVINKPAGVAVHPGNGMAKNDETLLDGLKPIFAKRKLPFSASDVLVHRLDKETTGCLLIAKNAKAHKLLQKQFESRSVSKFYLALVAGVPSPASAVIDAPIGRHTGDRTRMSIVQISASRSASTTYRTLSSSQGVALLSCELHTGRTHQIRVHLRAIGHPILGDEKYETTASANVTAKFRVHFLCLHAWKLGFQSPSGKKVSVNAEPPEKFLELTQQLGLKVPKSGNEQLAIGN